MTGNYFQDTGHAAVAGASERLDYAGMQARFQLALKDQVIELLNKEIALGLDYQNLALGVAGFIASLITTFAMRPDDPEDRVKLAVFTQNHVAGMLEGTDWSNQKTEDGR